MVTEEAPIKPNSPYSRTKVMMEWVLQDFCGAYGLRGIALRYFNPIGADPKLRSGIHVPKPTHVVGKLVDTALGKQPVFEITGTEWPTRDGTGIRDYIHVWDLAQAHVNAMVDFDQVFTRAGNPEGNYLIINLGTGSGVTVREIVTAFENVYGKILNKRDAPPRPGDVAGSYANADRAREWLRWEAKYSVEDGIKDALRWGEKRKEILGYP
jgi:UDP-glucose 4-epimerase